MPFNTSRLGDPKLEVMNYLNEVAMDYPDAISFASGRPWEAFFQLDDWPEQFAAFADYLAAEQNIAKDKINDYLGQYGRTAGCINALVAEQLKNDEDIDCSPEQIVITNGCQEAMTILMMAGCQDRVLLVTDPTYIGITGLAAIMGITCLSVSGENGLVSREGILQGIEEAKKLGKSVAAVYLIPDFDNPSGESITTPMRKELIDLCFDHDICIFEDNPYGLFYYSDHKQPTMYQLDDKGVVYHLGSFAKTMCPTLRIGYILAPNSEATNQLVKVKSLVSVNTSQFTQAVAGGILLQNGRSLAGLVKQTCDFYQTNRDAMITALSQQFDDMTDKVSWNNPQGGFFITVKMPFTFDEAMLKTCAAEYGILCMPRAYFSLGGQVDEYVRLSFSYVTPAQIEQGIAAFKQFTLDQMAIINRNS